MEHNHKVFSSLVVLLVWWIWKHINGRVFDGSQLNYNIILQNDKVMVYGGSPKIPQYGQNLFFFAFPCFFCDLHCINHGVMPLEALFGCVRMEGVEGE